MDVKITVLITTYNHESYVGGMIESIFKQSINVDQIIIADDCSQDDTINKVKNLARLHKKSIEIYVTFENSGVSENLMNAIGHIKNEIIIVGSGDDIFLNDRCEKVVEFLDENKKIMGGYTNLIKIDDTSNEIGLFYKSTPKMARGILDIIMLRNIYCVGASMFFRKDILNFKNNNRLKHISSDGVLAFRSIMEGGFGYLNKPTVKYRFHANNLSQNLTFEQKSQYWLNNYKYYVDLLSHNRDFVHGVFVTTFLRIRLYQWLLIRSVLLASFKIKPLKSFIAKLKS
jgi:glycosyltransferase involved in cell wall biosynthesis